jgi:hypothetical protein
MVRPYERIHTMATLPKATEVTKFVKYVRANDLLLKGRPLDDPSLPEGAGSWRYLVAAWLEVPAKDVTAAMVTTVKAADSKARETAAKANKAAKAKAAKDAPAKPVEAPSPAAFARQFAAWSDEDRAAFLAALQD